MSYFSRVGEMLTEGFKTLFEQYSQITLQRNPITNLITDIFGFGYNGGPIEGHKMREIILKDGKILGFRNYNEEKGETPLQNISELVFDQQGRYRGTGQFYRELTSRHFDSDFGRFGSATRLMNDDFRELEDATVITDEFMTDALRYYVKYGNRKPLGSYTNPDGSTSKIETTRITSPPKWVFEKFDPRGFDMGLALYHMAQTAIYWVFDTLGFDPFVENPIKEMNKWLKKNWDVKGPRLDMFINSEYVTVTEIGNALLGLPPREELYATV